MPNAKIRLLTNGRLLTKKIFEEIIQYLDSLCIENYNDEGILLSNVSEIYGLRKNNESYKKRVRILLRNETEILSTRGGLAKNRDDCIDMQGYTCTQPFLSMYAHPNGECSLCCADVYGEYVVGNINHQSLYEIWESENMNKFRKLISIGRDNIDKCKKCDQFISYPML